MVIRCKVENCKSGSVIDRQKRNVLGKSPVSLFKVPQDDEMFQKWKSVFNYLRKTDHVCEFHFLDEHVKKDHKIVLQAGKLDSMLVLRKGLAKNAVPVIATEENIHLMNRDKVGIGESTTINDEHICGTSNTNQIQNDFDIIRNINSDNDINIIEVVADDDPLVVNDGESMQKNNPRLIKILKPVSKPNLNVKLKPVNDDCIFVPLPTSSLSTSLPSSSCSVPVSVVAPKNAPLEPKAGLIKGFTPLPKSTPSVNSPALKPAAKIDAVTPIKAKLEEMAYVRNADGQYVKMFVAPTTGPLKPSSPKRRKPELIIPLQKLKITNIKQKISLKNIKIQKKSVAISKTISVNKKIQSACTTKRKPIVVVAKKKSNSFVDLKKNQNTVASVDNENVDPFGSVICPSDFPISKTVMVQTDSVKKRSKSVQATDDCEPFKMDTEGVILASTVKRYELKVMCRICFSKCNLVDIFEVEHENMKLYQILQQLTYQKITSKGSRYICQLCLNDITRAYKFKKAFQRASIIIQQILSETNDNCEVVEVFPKSNNEIVILEDDDTKNVPKDDHIDPIKEEDLNVPQQMQVQESAEKAETEYLGLLECQICDFEEEKSLNIMDRHYSDKHAVKLSANMKTGHCFSCDVDINRLDLGNHFNTDEHKNNYQQCYLCFEQFSTKKMLHTHMSNKHNIANGKIKELRTDYPCILCKIHFKTFKEVDDHFDQCHPESPVCIICNATIIKKCIKYHMLKHLPNGVSLCCRICRISFDNAEELKAHIELPIHTTCKICNVKVMDTIAYFRHMQKHKKTSFVCEVCGHVSGSQYNLSRHMEVHDRNIYYCDKCPKKFSNISCLIFHQRRHELVCQLCEADFDAEWKLILHKARHDVPSAIICPVPKCHKIYPNKDELTAHLTESHETFTCVTCSKVFYTQTTFIGHNSIHMWEATPEVDDPKTCKMCMKSFNSEMCKQMHVIHMHKVFICLHCPKLFSNKIKYQSHQMKDHNYLKSTKDVKKRNYYPCNICNKRLFSYSGYLLHERKHAGVKPFSCKYCPKNFVRKSYKDMHERTHTGDKRYACSICDKRFIQRTEMKRHERRHSKIIPTNPKRKRSTDEFEDINEKDHDIDTNGLEEYFKSQTLSSIMDDEDPGPSDSNF